MWVQNGVQVDSTHFSDAILKPKTTLYFRPSLGLQDFQQLKASMVREFIPPSLHIGGGNTTADESLNHSRLVGNTHYGLVEGDLPLLMQDSIWEFQAYAQEWFNFCSVGTQNPQQVLHMLHQPVNSAQTLASSPQMRPGSPMAEQYAEGVMMRIINEAVNVTVGKSVARAFRCMEREFLDDIVPALVHSHLDSAMTKLEINRFPNDSASDADYIPSSGAM
jgi:hypothetical protein